MDAEELLRRLALNDENVVRSAVGAEPLPLSGGPELDAKTNALVRLAALLSIGAATSSCRAAVECGRAAGATDAEIVGVLVAVAPAVGGARVGGAAPRLALAIDYDVEDVAEVWDGRCGRVRRRLWRRPTPGSRVAAGMHAPMCVPPPNRVACPLVGPLAARRSWAGPTRRAP